MNRKLFILAVILQSVLLLTMITRQEVLLKTGKKIMLKCKALDPRSLFSGDYVDLNYEISEINLNALHVQNNEESAKTWQDFSISDDIFVILKKNASDDFFSVSGISGLYSEPEKDAVVLRGKVSSRSSSALHVKYGIENYFVPQNEGKYIEDNMDNLHAEVSVKGKRCALSKLFLSGVEIKFY